MNRIDSISSGSYLSPDIESYFMYATGLSMGLDHAQVYNRDDVCPTEITRHRSVEGQKAATDMRTKGNKT